MNLGIPIQAALERLESRRGNLVEYVAESLRMPLEQARSFYAEQADAAALMLDNLERGEGFILGDMTGIGKGRVVAAAIEHALVNGRLPIFITDRPNLFRDILRDLEGIGTSYRVPLNPLILNDGVSIRNELGEEIMRSTPRSEVTRIMESGDLEDYNCLFLTYSQINRAAERSEKVAWLLRLAEGSAMVIDESHNAGGDSNTGDNVIAMLEEAHSVLYSSATYAKRPENMRVYFRTRLGDVARSEEFTKILQRGGEPLQEILSSMLAEAGQYIRREHDYSKAEFRVVVDDENSARHREIADQLSEIYALMAAISGEVQGYVREENKGYKKLLADLKQRLDAREYTVAKRMGLTSTNFASRLWNLNAQFLLALKAESIGRLAFESLEQDEKLVFALANTMESFLEEANALARAELREEGDETAQLRSAMDGVPISASFRDVLRRLSGRLIEVRQVDRYGNVEVRDYVDREAEAARPREERNPMALLLEELERKIDALPDLPLSPIDAVRQSLEAKGYRTGELTGRKLGINYLADGGPRIYQRPDTERKDRNLTIEAFNNGLPLDGGKREEPLDAVVINRSGATGISLHSDATFHDRRARHMMILQPELDVNLYIQLLGRIFRANMVGTPRYTTFLTDLPMEIRPAAMLNRKLSSLSANTASNRDNNAKLEAPDMLNWLGDKVALEFLRDNPVDMSRLQFDLEEEESRAEESSDTGLMQRLTGRLALLSVHRQEEVYAALERSFNDALAELERKGISPFRTREFDIRATEVERRLFEGSEVYASVFDAPVYLSTIEYDLPIDPMSHARAMEILEANRKQMRAEGLGRYPLEARQVTIGDMLDKKIDLALRNTDRFADLDEALAAEGSNLIKRYNAQKTFVRAVAQDLEMGRALRVSGEGDAIYYAYLVGFVPPENRRYDLFGQYELKVLSPDPAIGLQWISLATLFEQWQVDWQIFANLPALPDAAADFDGRPQGVARESRLVLTGNLLKAAQWSQNHCMGLSAIYTNEEGERLRGVILPRDVKVEHLMESAAMLENGRMVLDYLNDHRLRTPLKAAMRGGEVAIGTPRSKVGWEIVVPSSKKDGGKIHGEPRLTDIVGDFEGRGKYLRAFVDDPDALVRFVDALREIHGLHFYTPEDDAQGREWTNHWLERNRVVERVDAGYAEEAGMGR